MVHPDIWVGKAPEDDEALPEVLVDGNQDASALSLQDAETIDATDTGASGRLRVWTSHERVWQTVAGHGVDFKRVPGEEFRLLCMIAGAGERGIAQPDLVKQSKQDKKSVPGRTDNLNKAGYIRKTRILAEKHNTSLLTHRRFLQKDEIAAQDRPVFVNGSLSFDNLLAVLTEKLKNGVSMKMDELEEFLGCAVKSWEKRALWRALERLDIIGVVQRYRQDEHKQGKKGNMRVFKTKTLKLLREPTEADHKRYTSLTVKDRNDFRKRLEAQDAETQGEHAEYMDDDDYAPPNPAQKADGATNEETPQEETSVLKMQWDSDTAWTTTVFNAVDRAGTAGLSSMAAREATYGQFYDRPVEQMLARLTDVWQNAQPDHLAHFSIIRDTDTKGRSTNYLYRTHEAFQLAVDEGSTVWENATNGRDYKKPQPNLDQFGFNALDGSQFVKNGSGTLGDAVKVSKFEVEKLQRTDPIIETKADGSLRVVWNHEKGNKGPRKSKIDDELDDDAAASPRPKVAKRKYIKKAKLNESTQSGVGAESRTGDEWRLKAEEQAYQEAMKEQKKAPVTTMPGKQMDGKWLPGRGRTKMVLVDDSIPSDTSELPEAFAKAQKPPIMVLESRVRAILEALKPNTGASSEPIAPKPSTPAKKQRLVTLQSPRFNELAWFRDGAATHGSPILGRPPVLPEDGEDPQATAGANALPSTSSMQEKRTDSTRAESPLANSEAPVLVGSQTTEVVPSPPNPASSAQEKNSEDWLGQLHQATEPEAPEEPRKVGELSVRSNAPRKDWAQRQSTYIRPKPAVIVDRKKRGTVVGRGTAQYKRILLIQQIMEKSGGIFPGDSEMVPAFQKLQKTELKSETTSDRDTVMKAVKALVDDGKLLRFSFFFQDKNGKSVQKWIIHEPQISVDSQEIKDLMKKIEEAHPRNYVPPPYGDGETGRAEQRKNIDRFQYRPGKSIIQPSGTEFVIDVEAKRKELENQRLAAAAAIRAEEARRMKAQAIRNKQRNAAIARKPRRPRTLLAKTAQPEPWALDHMQDDDPDRVVQSVETDGMPLTHWYTGRPRYRDIRPAPPISALQIAKLDSGIPLAPAPAPMPVSQPPNLPTPALPTPPVAMPSMDTPFMGMPFVQEQPQLQFQPQLQPKPIRPGRPPIQLPGGQVLAFSGRRRTSKDQMRIKPSKYNRPIAQAKPRASRFTFRENQGPDTYDQYYELEDISTLLQPMQRFHPKTGTFGTDFFVRTNVRHSQWVQPTKFVFENHFSTNSEDIQLFNDIDDYDNHYHPDKQPRKYAPGLLSKKPVHHVEPNYDSDVPLELQKFEQKELRIMRQEFPDLIHEKPQDGFASYTFGGEQQTAEEMYGYGIRPMEHIVLHGADPEDFPGVEFEEHNRRPINPVEYTVVDSSSEDDEDEDEVETAPRVFRGPKRARRSRKVVSDSAEQSIPAAPEVLPAPAPRRTTKDSRSGGTQSGQCHITSADSRRLLFACIAVRVILNNTESNVNWALIQDVFDDHPNYDLPTFKARWNRMWNTHNDIVKRMEQDFQDAFADAYEKSLVPRLEIVHGNCLTYKDKSKWKKVVDWAVKSIPVFSDEIGLPATRDELGEGFQFKTEPEESQDTRDKMEHVHTTHAKREELAHGVRFHAPLAFRSRPTREIEVAKSWIRANCATSDQDYDAQAVNAKMQKLDQALVVSLTKEMHADRIIAHNFKLKNQATRNYHLSDQYNHIFNKRPLDAANFAEAIAFKAQLDKAFLSGNASFKVDPNITDGAAMAMTEMQGAGRIVVKPILPPINSTIGAPWPRLTVWGFNEGQYKLRNLDRKTFSWAVEIVPTSQYVVGLPARKKAGRIEPPRYPKRDVKGSERIPLWYDIQGNFIMKLWEGMVRSVIQNMALKAGSSAAVLAAPYRGLVWSWEVDLLVDWMIEVGVAERSESGGIRAAEWWWSVVPQQVVEEQDDEPTAAQDYSPAPAPKKRRTRAAKA